MFLLVNTNFSLTLKYITNLVPLEFRYSKTHGSDKQKQNPHVVVSDRYLLLDGWSARAHLRSIAYIMYLNINISYYTQQ